MDLKSQFCEASEPEDILYTTQCVVNFLSEVISEGTITGKKRHPGLSEMGEAGLSYVLNAVEKNIATVILKLEFKRKQPFSASEPQTI